MIVNGFNGFISVLFDIAIKWKTARVTHGKRWRKTKVKE